MMAIYLAQHGAATAGETDAERVLTDEGREHVRRIAATAAAYSVRIARVRHSGKARALQTAEIFAEALGVTDVAGLGGMGPADDVAAFAARLSGADEGTLFVGHLPFMERLAGLLVAGSAEIPVFLFQNGGIVCIDRREGAQLRSVKWALMPVVG